MLGFSQSIIPPDYTVIVKFLVNRFIVRTKALNFPQFLSRKTTQIQWNARKIKVTRIKSNRNGKLNPFRSKNQKRNYEIPSP